MPMPTDAKMQNAMHRGEKGVPHGMVVWMDDNGGIHMTDDYIAIQDMGFRENN